MITLISIAIATVLLCAAAAGLIASAQNRSDDLAASIASEDDSVAL